MADRPPDSPFPLKNPRLAALLAWMVPGLGHLYQGRRGKGLLYFVCILGLFIAGMVMGEGKVVFWNITSPTQDMENFRPSYLCQFFVGLPALPGLIQALLAHYGMEPILGGYLAKPPEAELNALFASGKLIEIGWLYTVIAGLLNILAIFDALEGPALASEDEDEEKERAEASDSDSSDRVRVEGLQPEGRA